MTKQELYQQISKSFSKEELRGLMFALNIDYDDIPDQTKGDKIRGLIQYCENRERLEDLINELSKLRPNLKWEIPDKNPDFDAQIPLAYESRKNEPQLTHTFNTINLYSAYLSNK